MRRLKQVASRAYWPTLCLFLASVTLINLVERRRIVAHQRGVVIEEDEKQQAHARLLESFAVLTGRRVRWPAIELVAAAASQRSEPGYGVIVVINGVYCSGPRNQVTDFLRGLQATVSNVSGRVSVIVVADDRRIAGAYREANKLTYGVYLDPDGRFLADNDLRADPVILVVDGDRRIVSVTATSSSQAQWTWRAESTRIRNLLVRDQG